MKQSFAALVLTLSLPSALLALGSDKAMYAGGTAATVPEKTEGRIDSTNPQRMTFRPDKGSGSIEIPWETVESIEYGQRVARRWKTAILISPVALFSKGRKHYVTVSYKDGEGVGQAAVFELGKDAFRPTLAALKARSGKDVLCQDEEGRKQMGGGCRLVQEQNAEGADKQ